MWAYGYCGLLTCHLACYYAMWGGVDKVSWGCPAFCENAANESLDLAEDFVSLTFEAGPRSREALQGWWLGHAADSVTKFQFL